MNMLLSQTLFPVLYFVYMQEQEYELIKKDLYKVLVLNALYLAAILVLYFTDQKSHYLQNWFAKILHF